MMLAPTRAQQSEETKRPLGIDKKMSKTFVLPSISSTAETPTK